VMLEFKDSSQEIPDESADKSDEPVRICSLEVSCNQHLFLDQRCNFMIITAKDPTLWQCCYTIIAFPTKMGLSECWAHT
jgi:hypothetical protein